MMVNNIIAHMVAMNQRWPTDNFINPTPAQTMPASIDVMIDANMNNDKIAFT
jgi:hypothetical protein